MLHTAHFIAKNLKTSKLPKPLKPLKLLKIFPTLLPE